MIGRKLNHTPDAGKNTIDEQAVHNRIQSVRGKSPVADGVNASIPSPASRLAPRRPHGTSARKSKT